MIAKSVLDAELTKEKMEEQDQQDEPSTSEEEEESGEEDQSDEEEDDEEVLSEEESEEEQDESDMEQDDDEDEEEADSADDGDDEGDDEGNESTDKSGWADAMAKVLNMGKTSSTQPALLSKAKKDTAAGSSSKKDKKSGISREDARLKRKQEEERGRKRPDVVADRAMEKKLSKVATRGVVQLFNAVREQQKSLKGQLDEAGKSVRKRDKVYQNMDKEGFLEVLAGGKKRKKEADSGAEVKTEPKEESSWKILRDDFMMGAKMKDWDKEDSE